jgi:predicted dehydrogenase
MRFALIGDHPDGLDMAAALAATGRHELLLYSGPPAGAETLRVRGRECRNVADLEEVLADPAVETVIVAGKLSVRGQQLRRTLQSERHVLCVHPPDPSADMAYEAALIQSDTKHILLPLLPDALHPAIVRLAEWVRMQQRNSPFRCLQVERWIAGPLFVPTGRRSRPSFPDWTVLRALAGEIVEVSAFASSDEIAPEEPLLLSGRFDGGGLLQLSILPGQRSPRWRVQVLGGEHAAELLFASGGQGSARFEWQEASGEPRVEDWPAWDPWPEMVRVFEQALTTYPAPARLPVRWEDSVRALELDDAARRSVERRRASTLEFQEVSEAVGFKGTMTLVGCAMLWGLLLLLILGNWYRPALWAIPVLLAGFLGLQLLRWFLPPGPDENEDESSAPIHSNK